MFRTLIHINECIWKLFTHFRTGDSEYNATIDATGNKIIEECLLGAPLPIEPNIYVKGPDSPQSECSQILAGKKIALPSNVLWFLFVENKRTYVYKMFEWNLKNKKKTILNVYTLARELLKKKNLCKVMKV